MPDVVRMEPGQKAVFTLEHETAQRRVEVYIDGAGIVVRFEDGIVVHPVCSNVIRVTKRKSKTDIQL